MYEELKKLLEAKSAAHWEYIDGLEICQLLALIAENERLERNRDMFKSQVDRQAEALTKLRGLFVDATEQCCKAERERDELKAENARSTEREILQLAEIESLRKKCKMLADDNLALLENPGDAL